MLNLFRQESKWLDFSSQCRKESVKKLKNGLNFEKNHLASKYLKENQNCSQQIDVDFFFFFSLQLIPKEKNIKCNEIYIRCMKFSNIFNFQSSISLGFFWHPS